jgi:hypothetical protein
LRRRIAASAGRFFDEREIDSIFYHAVLAKIPAGELRRLMADPSQGIKSFCAAKPAQKLGWATRAEGLFGVRTYMEISGGRE